MKIPIFLGKKVKIYFNLKRRNLHKNRKSTAPHSLMNLLEKYKWQQSEGIKNTSFDNKFNEF